MAILDPGESWVLRVCQDFSVGPTRSWTFGLMADGTWCVQGGIRDLLGTVQRYLELNLELIWGAVEVWEGGFSRSL